MNRRRRLEIRLELRLELRDLLRRDFHLRRKHEREREKSIVV